MSPACYRLAGIRNLRCNTRTGVPVAGILDCPTQPAIDRGMATPAMQVECLERLARFTRKLAQSRTAPAQPRL